ncbi:hypothetical protein [Streptomyces sp. NPDC046909]|uniref:hypothetical protein n=1 Tax=Streptomyces sp. NPDC046909 TaxID=3155617 RepID=UPI0033DF6A75
MEDALSSDIDLVEHVESSPVPLPGIELAEALHHEQYPALIRFLLLNGASWAEGSRPTKWCSRAVARNARVSARGVHPLTVHAP